jgi:hypothetical protein
MAGSFRSEAGDLDGFVAKYDPTGELQWFQAYGGDSLDIARDIIQTADGGYSIVGSTESYSPHTEAWHLRLDAEGEELWFRNWGQIDDQESHEHFELGNGEFITLGYTKTSGGGGKDMFLLKSAPDGWFLFGRTFGGSDDEEGYGLAVLDDGFLCGGYTYSYGGGMSDVFLVRTGLDGTTETDQVISSFDPLSIQDPLPIPTTLEVFPNPSDGTFHLGVDQPVQQLKVLDAAGRIVGTPALSPGERTVRTTLPNGSYIVEVLLQDGTSRRARILIVRS